MVSKLSNINLAVCRRLGKIYQRSGFVPEQEVQADKHINNTERVLGMLLAGGPLTVQQINASLGCNDGGRYVRFLSEAGFEILRTWVGNTPMERSHKEYALSLEERLRILNSAE